MIFTNLCRFGVDMKERSLAKTHETIFKISYLRLDGIRGGVHLNRIGMDVKCAPWECGVFEYMPCTPGECGVFQVHYEPRVWEDM